MNKTDQPNTPKVLSQQTKAQQLAELSLSPTATNAMLAHTFNKNIVAGTTLPDTLNSLTDKVAKVHNGSLTDLEETLTAQVCSLNTIYCELAARAAGTDNFFKMQTFLRLSFKAQAQCARTIEVLAALKNPPVVFAKQANITSGPQQINNGVSSHTSRAHAHAHR